MLNKVEEERIKMGKMKKILSYRRNILLYALSLLTNYYFRTRMYK